LRLVSNVPIAAVIEGETAPTVKEPDGGQKVEYTINSTGEPIDLSVTPGTGVNQKATTFPASYLNAENPQDVRLSPARLLVPWATIVPSVPKVPPRLPTELVGGNPERGRVIFYGEQARCASCHAIGGKGGNVGPELGHQFERPPAEVYRDITDPGLW